MYALNSNIMRLNMSDYGNQLFCVWPGLLCLSSSIDIESRRIGSILGGFVTGTDKRFTLHKLTGQGEVFLSGPGLSKVDIDHGTLVEFPSHRVIAFTEGMNPRKLLALLLYSLSFVFRTVTWRRRRGELTVAFALSVLL